MTNNCSIDNLLKLKTAYEDGLVSALVGAGFSKNVYKLYPSWPELLEDIVKILYPTEYKQVERARQKAKLFNSDKPLNDLVNRIGPLNIVSKYIEYRGVGHESIDVYIESKIPSIKASGENMIINGSIIKEEALTAHEALLNCDRIKNIYTTNYDNLLEFTRDHLGIPYFKSTINNAQDLSGSLSKQSIIKVHGDLRTGRLDSETTYEFDKDKNALYIISKEDYENYQQKHEAFSFMMRLAMLQGNFCLVGFSGNDPNFQFWLQWMKDIIDKDEKNDVKVFLIDFLEDDLAEDVKLFYKNHHIGVINLLDSGVQSILFPNNPPNIEDNALSEAKKGKDWKLLITGLFQYLKGSPKKEPKREIGVYYSLWSEAEQLANDKQDVSSVVERLLKVRESLGPQKNVEYQNLVLNKLRRKKNWTGDESELFSIAMTDMGLYPTMFSKELEHRDICLKNNLIWKSLQEREYSLCGDDTLLSGSDDQTNYENALRLLFGFRFTELKELLEEWIPTGDYIYRISLLLSYFDKEKTKHLIDSFINNNSQSAQKRLLASQVANLVYGEIPYRYPLDHYFDQGLSSFYDIVTYISRNWGNKQQKILPYSIEERTFYLSKDNRPFRESSRILSYLINWGYSTFYKYVTCISEEIWMSVFVELFEYYPLAVLYYSSLYANEKLLKRIGQEYAFSSYLHKYNVQEELLQCVFRGLSDENIPLQNRKGLLIISSEIYISVKEELWYEDFRKVIFIPYLTTINEDTESSGDVYTNISKAFGSIHQREHVEECFKELVGAINKNSRLVTEIINDHFPVGSLNGCDYEELLMSLVEQRNLFEIYPVFYIMNHYGLLSDSLLQAFDKKAIVEGFSFAQNDKTALVQLSYILSSKTNLSILKKMIVGKNVWNCGISNGVFSASDPIRIDRLSKNIVWDDEEKSILLENLENNLNLISNRDKDSKLEPLLFSKNADLLFSMISFFSNNYEALDNKDIEYKLKSTFDKECEISHNLKGLASSDEDHVFVSIKIVNTILSKYRITKTLHEISVILNRALQKNKIALSLVLSEISVLVEKFENDMWSIYHDILLQILRDYKDVDYRELNLNLSNAYEYLNRIAHSAKNQGVDDECVDYWLTNDEVLRFNNINA